jgi:aminopeptidase-like protein
MHWSLVQRESEGRAMHELATELYPLARSITGDGLRATLNRLGEGLPFHLHEVKTGTLILDWTVPKEWNCKEAWIKGPDGEIVVDYARSNLHLMGYSTPLHERMPLERLQKHLYSLPEQPDCLPWKTSYYQENWGFSLPHREREKLVEGEYEVFIDASLKEGSLSYGEIVLPGRREEEILISAHACHPSLANDNLSGLVVTRALAWHLAERPRRFTYRFVYAPGTVGAIAWIARNLELLGLIRGGLIVAGVGDRGGFTYKRSRAGSAELDRIVARILDESGEDYQIVDFSPDGYDERQYNSPGVGLPVGRLSRTPWGSYPQYHTSGDDLAFLSAESLAGSLEVLLRVCGELEDNTYYRNLLPVGEPQLGRRGLYTVLGGHRGKSERESAMLWLLNFSDGVHSLRDLEELSGHKSSLLAEMAKVLEEHELLRRED